MHASSRLSFSSGLEESRSRRLLRRHRLHLPHPTRKSHVSQEPTATSLEPDTEAAIITTMTPAAPLDSKRLPLDPD